MIPGHHTTKAKKIKDTLAYSEKLDPITGKREQSSNYRNTMNNGPGSGSQAKNPQSDHNGRSKGNPKFVENKRTSNSTQQDRDLHKKISQNQLQKQNNQ